MLGRANNAEVLARRVIALEYEKRGAAILEQMSRAYWQYVATVDDNGGSGEAEARTRWAALKGARQAMLWLFQVDDLVAEGGFSRFDRAIRDGAEAAGFPLLQTDFDGLRPPAPQDRQQG